MNSGDFALSSKLRFFSSEEKCYLCCKNQQLLTMRQLLVFVWMFTFVPSLAMGQSVNLDSIYKCLDDAIAHSDRYLKKKNATIDSLQQLLADAEDDKEKYDVANLIFREYRPFVNDSAIVYINKCLQLARKLGRNDLLALNYVRLGHQYALTGYYNEALKYFGKVDKQSLTDRHRSNYYFGMNHLYNEMAFYSKDEAMKADFEQRAAVYQDSLYAYRQSQQGGKEAEGTSNLSYYQRRCMQLCNEGKAQEAMVFSDLWRKEVAPNSRGYAIMAYCRSEIYKSLNDTEQQKFWLAESALSDIKSAVMDQASLWNLAQMLSEDGDVGRAYRYMEFSWESISRFCTHMRSWLVTPVLTSINSNYRDKLRTANTRLTAMMGALSVLAVFLLGMFIYVNRKKQQLAVAQGQLSVLNGQLKDKNEQLTKTNLLLSDANEKLQGAILHLNDSNRVKDEYIGKFLSICAEYINKLDNNRMKVNRKLRANQYRDLLRMTESGHLRDEEQSELLAHFDTVFLRLFPTFVDEFNGLLRPEERICDVKKGELTTELRIFALIRLGIHESSRIAEFLHYTPNSIYAYRARTKNKAAGSRDDFERQVKEIGIVG